MFTAGKQVILLEWEGQFNQCGESVKYRIGDRFAVCGYDDLYEIVEVIGYVDYDDTSYQVEYRTGSAVGVCWDAMHMVLEPVERYHRQQELLDAEGR